MKPILISGTPDKTCEGERVARFGGKIAGGRVINCALMTNFVAAAVQKQLDDALAAGQVAELWWYPDHSTINSAGWSPDLLPDSADNIKLTAMVTAYCECGGLVLASIMEEMEQYQKFGPDLYRKNYDIIASRLPPGCIPVWTKGPNPAMAKYGGPLKFADWKPELAKFSGGNAFADCVYPGTPRGDDFQRWLHDPCRQGMPFVLGGGFSSGDILDPAQAKPWIKAYLAIALNEANDVRAAGPFNQDFSGFPGIGASNGRYAPGAHQPPLATWSPPWPGSPEFCGVLDKSYAVPGQWLHAGEFALPDLAAALAT